MTPLAVDLFCGLGGWTDGLLVEGYEVVGFDIERHQYGGQSYPAQLVIQDVLTLHGSQFRTAALIVASPPCQEFSYMAMPWSLAKEKRRKLIEGPPEDRARLTALFDACFRIQREACAAAGRHIPMVVENVRGAQEWVGRARWNFGSFYLWGDVPALMPPIFRGNARLKTATGEQWNVNRANVTGTQGWSGSDRDIQSASVEATGHKSSGLNWSNRELRGQDFTRIAGKQAEGRKGAGTDAAWFDQNHCALSSKSPARKAAAAAIAKIPPRLSQWVARCYAP